MARKNFLYGNNTTADLDGFHAEIAASLEASGTLPEALADIFVARLVPADLGNPDGTPRYMIDWA